MSEAEEALSENFIKFLEDGPRLRYDYNTPVLAICSCGDVLLGGLGGCGVGQMWFPWEERYKDYPGYNEAERITHETP